LQPANERHNQQVQPNHTSSLWELARVFGHYGSGKPISPNNVLRQQVVPACDALGLNRVTCLTSGARTHRGLTRRAAGQGRGAVDGPHQGGHDRECVHPSDRRRTPHGGRQSRIRIVHYCSQSEKARQEETWTPRTAMSDPSDRRRNASTTRHVNHTAQRSGASILSEIERQRAPPAGSQQSLD
jgi:hypothetical protein